MCMRCTTWHIEISRLEGRNEKRRRKRDREAEFGLLPSRYMNFLFDLIADPLTKNRGIDWSRDFRYCREVGLPWQRSPSKSRLLVDLPYKPRYSVASVAALDLANLQNDHAYPVPLRRPLTRSLREFKIEQNNSRFACCTMSRGMPKRCVNIARFDSITRLGGVSTSPADVTLHAEV